MPGEGAARGALNSTVSAPKALPAWERGSCLTSSGWGEGGFPFRWEASASGGSRGSSVCLRAGRGSSQAAHLSWLSGIFLCFWCVSASILGGSRSGGCHALAILNHKHPPAFSVPGFRPVPRRKALRETSLCLSLSSRHEATAPATEPGEGAGSGLRVLTRRGRQRPAALKPPGPASAGP